MLLYYNNERTRSCTTTWDQGISEKIPWDKWKWERNPEAVGHNQSSSKREIKAIEGYVKTQQTSQIHNLTLHLKELEKEEQWPKWVEQRK